MQPKRFPTSLTAGLLAAVACLSTAAAAADGVCDPLEAQAGLCFVSPQGFVVEAVTGPGGEFPILDSNGNSVFSYLVTGPGVAGGSCQAVHAISHASILVPALCGTSATALVEASPAAQYKTGGVGDPSCGFGSGDSANDVLKWDAGVGCNSSALYTLVLAGTYAAAPTDFSLKAGPNCSVGTILGPACSTVVRFCPSSPNSSGEVGTIEFDGSYSISENNFYLLGAGLPPDEPGYYYFGTAEVDVPFGNGRRCVGGTVNRLQKIGISLQGDSVTHFNLTVPPLNSIVPGVPYYFQLYYRDSLGGGAQFSTTDALAIIFTP